MLSILLYHQVLVVETAPGGIYHSHASAALRVSSLSCEIHSGVSYSSTKGRLARSRLPIRSSPGESSHQGNGVKP